MVRISYMGIPFSNSEEAASRFAASRGWQNAELVAAVTSEGVVRSLRSGESDYGAVASSNITAGTVEETRKALEGADDIETVDTVTIPIHHCVFVKRKDAKIDCAVSHVQALLQTAGNLERLYPGTRRIEVEDTAYAAKMLAEGSLPETAAVICRRNAGEHYGLVLAHENIEDRGDNMTTFLLLRIRGSSDRFSS